MQGILGDERLREQAEKTLASVGQVLRKAPSAVPLMTCALGFALSDPMHVVIVGPPAREDTLALLRAVHSVYPYLDDPTYQFSSLLFFFV